MLFSIVVPVYNSSAYLQQCLDSIASQTFTDYEAILVDDGSTDGCARILDEFAGRHAQCKVVHKANGGVTSARKAGVAVAQGEYITHLDSDDYLAPVFLERFADIICAAAEPADLYFCGHTRIEEGDGKREVVKRASSLNGGEGVFDREEIENIFIPNLNRWRHTLWGVVIRRELSQRYMLRVDDEVTYGEDKCVLWPGVCEARRIAMILDPIYYYRVHSQSMMHCKEKKFYWSSIIRRFELLESAMPMDKFNLRNQLSIYAAAVCFRGAVSDYKYMSCREATGSIRAALSTPIVNRYFEKMPVGAGRATKAVYFMLKHRILLPIQTYSVLIEPNIHILRKLFPKLK